MSSPPPTAPGPANGSSQGGISPPLLPIILPVVLGAAVIAAAALFGIKVVRSRRAGRVVAAPPSRAVSARSMLGKWHCTSKSRM